MANRALWHALLASTAGLMLLFLLVPVIALIVTLDWAAISHGINHPSVWPALRVSLETTFLSLLIILLFGTPLAWVVSQRSGRGIRAIETTMRLPAVLPPAVAGVALFLAFGTMGLLGGTLSALGLSIPFTKIAVVLAQVFVAAPFYLQSATEAFRRVDNSQLLVARTLGAGPARVFFRIAIPLAIPGLVSGAAMAWARALGEFGATMMFAGRTTGTTETLTTAVYTAFDGADFETAQVLSVILVLFAFTILLSVAYLTRIRTERP